MWRFLLIVLLLTLLPHHGAITVFAPEWVRWWKEGILLLLGLCALPSLWKNKNIDFRFPQFWAWLFLLWGGVLIALNPDPKTALIAFRYLGLGYVVFLLFSSLLDNQTTKQLNDRTTYLNCSVDLLLRCFVVSLSVSVLFGFWAHFLGGYEVLTAWYSSTISSWVPGQTIPLYHESDGIIRMQGTSSGPIEFSHLLVIGVYLLLFQNSVLESKKRKAIGTFARSLILGFFIFGIYFSHSRAAMIAVVVLLFAKVIQQLRQRDFEQFKTMLVSVVIGVVLSGVVGSFFAPSWISRAGTSDHITKPIEALKTAVKKPITGHLGTWGPAARAKNLAENNDDKAPIAENVFADYFVQLGILGLLFGVGFLWSLWRIFYYEERVFLITFFILINLATVLDMTPLSIAFFFFLAFLYQKDIDIREEE